MKRRTLSLIDSKTGDWIHCFPILDRVRCFVRDIKTGWFIKFVRKLYILYSASWVYCRRKSISSNIIYSITISIAYDFRDIALNKTVEEFDNTLVKLDSLVSDFVKVRLFAMTHGAVETEYVGVEHTVVHTESSENLCRCPGEGVEKFVYSIKKIEALQEIATDCKHYDSFCADLARLSARIRPMLGAYSDVVFPSWCRGYV